MSEPIAPGEVEVYAHFSKHLGPRFVGAGVRLQFHYNQIPGIHLKVSVREEYRAAILKGITDAMSIRFPNFPETGSVWITEVTEHPVDSSEQGFYLAAGSAVDLAYNLTRTKDRQG
ncbi:MAG: hypothetical protein WAN76_19910 [Candidatus Sulfotelmatobacter sp.]